MSRCSRSLGHARSSRGARASRAALVAWSTLLLLGWPAHGEAQDQRPLAEALHVEPGASCVTGASLTPQVEAWLGSDRLESELTVIVRGSPTDARDVAFEVRRGDELVGQRRFLPAPWVCAQLEATLALAIAMALKVSLRDELLDTLGGAEANRAPLLGGLVRAGFDLLPGVSVGAGLAAAQAVSDHFGVRAELFADGARDAGFTDAGGSFDTLLLSAQLSGCALVPIRPGWGARACVGFALGALEARGSGYARSRKEWLAWLSAQSSIALSARLGERWWLELPGSIVVPLNKLTFGVERADGSVASVVSLPRVGFTLALGPLCRF